MSQKSENLLRRVFQQISPHYFGDHKANATYCTDVRFSRSLGDEIGQWVSSRDPQLFYDESVKAGITGMAKPKT